MNLLRPILGLAAILLASCASDSDSETGTSTANAGYKPMSQRLNESNGYKVDSDGNWVPKNDKRSAYDGHGSPAGMKGDVGKKAYQAGKLQQKLEVGLQNAWTGRGRDVAVLPSERVERLGELSGKVSIVATADGIAQSCIVANHLRERLEGLISRQTQHGRSPQQVHEFVGIPGLHTIVVVDWLTEHPNINYYGSSCQVFSKQVLPQSEARFMPIERILSRCAAVHHEVPVSATSRGRKEHLIVVIPLVMSGR